ncbi:MAG: signal transduction histidine kinase, nitrogen specific, NtrB [Acidobacteriaceae bacterium]|nr:signal transduction histidine kinase, nitrogen specific, NtrB [Acidobacteriaceae bacterium]
MQSAFENRVWLTWLVKVRILILTVLLGIELVISQFTPVAFPLRLFADTILLAYTISAFYLVLLHFWDELKPQAVLQVVTDLLLVSLFVYVTGGVDSSLNFLYPLVIIVANILLPRVWAYLTAALAFILYGTVLELSFFGVVPSFSVTHPGIRTLQSIIFVNLFGFLTIAYLAGLLSDKLRQTDRRLAYFRGELESLQALHENIVKSTSDGLITTGLDGRITLVNPAAEKLLQHTEIDLLGKPIASLFEDSLPHASSEHLHSEVRFVAPQNFRKTFRIIVSELRVPGRGPVGFVYTLDDLTQIRRLEREVRIQDRLAAIGRLAAAIAHEVRNPLTSIAGSASLLSEMPGVNDEHRHLLQIVTRESERLNGIITDFLAYSRPKQYRYAAVDMVPLLEDTLTLLEHRLEAEKIGIRIERHYGASKAFVLADGDRMKQVFWNFCENAVRAMNQGGTLTISIEELGNEWQFSFADTGPGMSPQMVEKVFEPFQSQFEGGTGLGLAIVYQIVQAHEGKVWVRSKSGQGCTFVLRMRKAAEEAMSLRAPKVSATLPESSQAEGAHA